MTTARTALAAGLLVVETGLAVLGVLFHYGLTAEYGNIDDSALEGLVAGFTAGVGGLTVAVVGSAAVVALAVATHRWMRVTALALPVLMLVGMFAATPAALQRKLEVQYDATPQCVSTEDMGPGPGTRAAQESQAAFESIEHVGHFSGGGGSGVGGCDRSFVLMEDVDVLQHYREALADAGWRVVEDGDSSLRGERDGMAFEVTVCDGGGVVWAGRVDAGGGARCGGSEQVGLSAG